MRLGKIIGQIPGLNDEDHEAVRQHAIAALNLTQQATLATGGGTTPSRLPTPPWLTACADLLWMCENSTST
jgi:hypothetical protein